MARPFYPHEADDADLDWLVSNFLCDRPNYMPIESGMLPLILLPYNEPKVAAAEEEFEPAEFAATERTEKRDV